MAIRPHRRQAASAALAALAVLVLAAPAEAESKTRHYEGVNVPAGGGANYVVRFDVLKRKDGKRFVKRFSVQNLPWSCDNATSGYYPTQIDFPRRMRVRSGDFAGSATDFWWGGNPENTMTGEYDVSGHLFTGGTASGTVHLKVIFPATPTCESTNRDWSAQRVTAP